MKLVPQTWLCASVATLMYEKFPTEKYSDVPLFSVLDYAFVRIFHVMVVNSIVSAMPRPHSLHSVNQANYYRTSL